REPAGRGPSDIGSEDAPHPGPGAPREPASARHPGGRGERVAVPPGRPADQRLPGRRGAPGGGTPGGAGGDRKAGGRVASSGFRARGPGRTVRTAPGAARRVRRTVRRRPVSLTEDRCGPILKIPKESHLMKRSNQPVTLALIAAAS